MNGIGRVRGSIAVVGFICVLGQAAAGCYKCTSGADILCRNDEMGPAPPASDVPGGPKARPRKGGLGADSATALPPAIPLGIPARSVQAELFDSVRTVLQIVSHAQERVHTETGSYTVDLQQLMPDGTGAIQLKIESASAAAWSASATRNELNGLSCVVTKSRAGAPPRIYTRGDKRAGHSDPGTIMCDTGVR